ncbi:protein of unknown function DUF1610 [Archaeoglobus veneficus SNP6]|uniref:Small zinc finger protein HVO-2753-like zinc-binding pocket domain-containing protein n=2 Tax=Archaeoglobus veneficus TaxID=58290 RepID=F2KRU4_ARCVS|nr:protein of unknown function DUF1610 [Archaeoglobus veneficus SNP6]
MRRGMVMDMHHCVTCGNNLFGTNYVVFPCPTCGEMIYRCKRCRKLANPYKCENCGFIGP